jgi:serine/threonine-protein kinase
LATAYGLAAPALTQNPPPATFRPGPFQPVARVDPSKPIRVQIVNKASEPVEYILTTQTGFRQLAPGQTAQLNGLSLPTYLNINPTRDRSAVRYSVSTGKDNTAIIEVYPGEINGFHSVNIDRAGGIYIY